MAAMAAMAAMTSRSAWPGLSARVAGDRAGNGFNIDSNVAVSVRRRRCDPVASKIHRICCRDADVSTKSRRGQIGCSSRAIAQRQCCHNFSPSSPSSSSSSSSSSCSNGGLKMAGMSFSSVRGSKCVAGTCSAVASFGAKCRIMGAVLAGTSRLPVTKFGSKVRTIAAVKFGAKCEMRAKACASEGRDGAKRESSTKNTVLVTGGAGFIGSHVAAALLSRGDRVVVVDELNDAYDPKRKEANLKCLAEIAQRSGEDCLCVIQADVADRAEMERLFESQAIDMVCHLAARAGVRASLSIPDKYVRTNVEGTTILLDLAVKSRSSNFVYASSSSVYGDRPRLKDLSAAAAMATDQGTGTGTGTGTGPGTGPGTGTGTGTGTPLIFDRFRDHLSFKEGDVADSPRSPYAATKRAGEMMARIYHDVYGLHTTGLRFFTVYGPRGRPDMAPFKFIDRISRGLPIERYGDGTSWRDYTFIDDVVDGILSALDRPFGCEVFNLGAGQPVLLSRFIEAVEEVVGKKATIIAKPEQPGDVSGTYADISKASQMLYYNPKVEIEDGLRQTYTWYCEVHKDRRTLISTTSS